MLVTLEEVARKAHEMNRRWCNLHNDFSQPEWRWVEPWQKESLMEGVRAILMDPSITPRRSHELWMARKEKEGWVYGPEKDANRKTHPCMLPYDQLSLEHRVKVHIFHAVVNSLLNR